MSFARIYNGFLLEPHFYFIVVTQIDRVHTLSDFDIWLKLEIKFPNGYFSVDSIALYRNPVTQMIVCIWAFEEYEFVNKIIKEVTKWSITQIKLLIYL